MTRAPRQLRRYSTPSFIRNAGLCIRDKPAMKASASKNLSLEGLRGLAALAVFSCHFLYVFFPYLARGRTVDQSGFVPLWHWETWFARAPFTLLYNGDFAVAVFFVLSGYVLTRKFWNNGDVTSLTAGACLA